MTTSAPVPLSSRRPFLPLLMTAVLSPIAFAGALAAAPPAPAKAPALQRVVLSADGKGFALADSGARFVPWGHNYGCFKELIEETWARGEPGWKTIEEDFRELKDLGTTVIRVHLQTGAFLKDARTPDPEATAALTKLCGVAERVGVHLDVTGLACYRAAKTPKWYDDLDEAGRWGAQAVFWEAVAGACKDSPAVFCYDLMNEPISPSGERKPGEWMSGKPLGGLDFVQFISLSKGKRERWEVARDWIRTLVPAIRKHDPKRLVTVGMLPWVEKWGHLSGFTPAKIAPEVDFVSVHIYPSTAKPAEAVKALDEVCVGKPVVIEETFPLSCTPAELKAFLLESRGKAAGWIGHYDGRSRAELGKLKEAKKLDIGESLLLAWLDLFVELGPVMTGAGDAKSPK